MQNKYTFTSPYPLGLPVYIIKEMGELRILKLRITSITFCDDIIRIGAGSTKVKFMDFSVDAAGNIITQDCSIFFYEEEAQQAAKELFKASEIYKAVTNKYKKY